MELVKKNIHFNRMAKEARNQITLEEDVNIPDTKEDIESILFRNYRVIVEEVRAGEQKVHIRGKMLYTILYRSEETGRLCAMEGSIPIDEQLYMEGVGSGDKVMVKTMVEDFSVGIINSRKISIQSILELYAYVQEMYDEQITTGIENAECEIQHKECDFTQMAVCKKDIFRFRENVNIPNNMPNVEDIVFSAMQVQDLEYKPLDDQLSVQGKVHVFVIYDGERDSRDQMYQATIPFNAMIECSGSNMNMTPEISYDIADSQMHLETDFDGEARSFAVEMVMELDIKLYEPQKVAVLWDTYGIQKELTPVVENINYDVLTARPVGNIKVSEKMKLEDVENGQAKVLYSDGRSVLEKCEVTDEGIMLSGIVICQVLYQTGMEGNDYQSMQCVIPFTKAVEMPEGMSEDSKANCKAQTSLWQLQCTPDMDGNMEVKAAIAYDVLVFEKMEGRNITAIDVKEMDMEKCNNLPSMAIYFAKPGDTLWEMGKKYCVPIKLIKDMNHMSSDEMKAGDKVLIVRGMGA